QRAEASSTRGPPPARRPGRSQHNPKAARSRPAVGDIRAEGIPEGHSLDKTELARLAGPDSRSAHRGTTAAFAGNPVAERERSRAVRSLVAAVAAGSGNSRRPGRPAGSRWRRNTDMERIGRPA